METATLKEINELLKDAPENILERTLGYIEGILTASQGHILHEPNLRYKLSEVQMRDLDAMENLKDEDLISREELHKNIQEKYGF